MNKLIFFFVNGEKYLTNSPITILDIITYFNYNKSLLILEYNHLICNRKDWDRVFIKSEDKIEIITIVGGG